MLRSKVHAPVNGELELPAALLQNLDSFGVGETYEVVLHHEVQTVYQFLVEVLVQEGDVVGTMLQSVVDAVFDEFLGEIHVVLDLVECHLGLNHPELGEVAGCIGVFGAERRAEGVDAAQRRGAEFTFQLAGYRQRRHLAEEILRIVYLTILCLRQIVQWQGRNLELSAGALAVGGRDKRGVEIIESLVVEELMHGESQRMAYTEHCAERVGARTQMRFLAQELQSVALLLQGICGRVGGAVQFELIGLHLYALSFAGTWRQYALHVDGAAGGDGLQIVLRSLRQVEHYLQVVDGAAVVQGHELHVLVATAGTHPALYVYFLALVFRGVGKQLLYCCSANLFHIIQKLLDAGC